MHIRWVGRTRTAAARGLSCPAFCFRLLLGTSPDDATRDADAVGPFGNRTHKSDVATGHRTVEGGAASAFSGRVGWVGWPWPWAAPVCAPPCAVPLRWTAACAGVRAKVPSCAALLCARQDSGQETRSEYAIIYLICTRRAVHCCCFGLSGRRESEKCSFFSAGAGHRQAGVVLHSWLLCLQAGSCDGRGGRGRGSAGCVVGLCGGSGATRLVPHRQTQAHTAICCVCVPNGRNTCHVRRKTTMHSS